MWGCAQLIPSQGWKSVADGWRVFETAPSGGTFAQAAGTRQGKVQKCKCFTVHGAAGQMTEFPGVSFFRGMDFISWRVWTAAGFPSDSACLLIVL